MSRQDRSKPILLAIFLVPLGLVLMGLQYSTRFASVLQDDGLEANAEAAKRAGFSFSKADLKGKSTTDPSRNGFKVIRSWFIPNEKALKETFSVASDYCKDGYNHVLDAKERELLVAARHLGQYTQNDPGDFVSKDSFEGDTYSIFPTLRKAHSVLCYEALYQAKRGNSKEAIANLKGALNISRQGVGQPDAAMVSMGVGLLGTLYQTCVHTASVFRQDPQAINQILKIIDSEVALTPIRDCLNYEFYFGVSQVRNFQGYKPLSDSLTFYTGPGGECEAGGEYPTPTEPIRSGLPKALVARTMTNHYVNAFLQFDEILKSEKDFTKLGPKMDQVIQNSYDSQDPYLSLLHIFIPDRSDVYVSWLKPGTQRTLARWAIKIIRDSKGGYPNQLPPQKDPSFNGNLEYRKLGNRFLVFSPGGSRDLKRLTNREYLPAYGNNTLGFTSETYPLPYIRKTP